MAYHLLQYRHTHRQRGMTLIEFMVGMAIGLLVVLAAIGSSIMIRNSARSMNEGAALEQQATLVMTQIGQQISQAGAVNLYLGGTDPNAGISGYASVSNSGDGAKIKFDTRNIGITNGNPVSVFGQTDGLTGFDTLTITYAQPNDGAPANNCNGTPAADLGNGAAPRIVNIFSVDKAGNLLCGSDTPDAQRPIASNIADMRITYLVVSGGKVAYRTAGQVTNWANVNGIQVCLAMQGDISQEAPKQDYTGTGQQDCRGNSLGRFTDGRVHLFVRQTFYLRNT